MIDNSEATPATGPIDASPAPSPPAPAPATPAFVRGRKERRIHARVMPTDQILVQFECEGKTYQAPLRDVSSQGCGLAIAEQPLPIPAGQVIDLSFGLPRETVRRRARIVSLKLTAGHWRVGFEYLEPGGACIGVLNLDQIRIDPTWALKTPASLALRRLVLPFAADDRIVYVACLEPCDASTKQALEKAFGMPLRFEAADPESLKRTIDRVYGDLQGQNQQRFRSVDLRSLQNLQPEDVVGLCDELMHAAILRQASDIHIDAEPAGVHIRFRVDGVLDTYRRWPAVVHNGIISRFKVLASMDIAEKRAPQDGAFKHRFGRAQQTVDVRVATLPTKHGERMTLRLLALQTESLTLERLGMLPRDLEVFQQAIDRPHGMILLTGPTGSGKSTTLYAAIRRILAREKLNVITVEDPIEYEIPGVAQTEIDQADKVTFIKALRSVLRHDPDVVMIGEIRDAETADVAIKASLTGHLVLSTLHTNSAASVITRLADMGVDRYLVAATLRLAVAQRLVRRLCPRCRWPRDITTAEAAAFQRPYAMGTDKQTAAGLTTTAMQVHDPGKCIYCGGHGYIARLGLFEMLPVDDDLARLIAEGADETRLLVEQRQKGFARLIDDGFEKAMQGVTSVREVLGAVAVW